jgi:XTP/dITP diphosphohydrolase
MRTLIMASSNPNKIREIREILAGQYEIKGLADIGCTEDIPETADTIEGNALLKVRYLAKNYGVDGFAEDTGLEIEALNGEPGVHTARYAGEQRDNQANINLVQQKLGDKPNRRARFKTVMALILNGQEHLFEGIVVGRISPVQQGEQGFGYDPVFIPDGYEQTFAEMDKVEKNRISHRGRALAKMMAFLEEAVL